MVKYTFSCAHNNFNIKCQTLSGRSTNNVYARQISGETKRILFDVGKFCSLNDDDTRLK